MVQLLSFELSEIPFILAVIYVGSWNIYAECYATFRGIKYSQLHSITKVLRWQNDTLYFR